MPKYERNKTTGHKSTFFASLFGVLGSFLAIFGLGQEMFFFLDKEFKNLFNHFNNNFFYSQLCIFVAHWPNFIMYFLFGPKKHF